MRGMRMYRRIFLVLIIQLLYFSTFITANIAVENNPTTMHNTPTNTYPDLHLTPAESIKAIQPTYEKNTKANQKNFSLTQLEEAYHEMLKQKETAILEDNIKLAKEIESLYYELLLQSPPMLNSTEKSQLDSTSTDLYLGIELESAIPIDSQDLYQDDNNNATTEYEQELSMMNANNILPLGIPFDLSIPEGYMVVFEFTSGQAGNYKFFTGPYGGYGADNDTMLYLFADEDLDQLLAFSDDANGSSFSELNVELPSNATVFLVLLGYNYEEIDARLTATFTTLPFNLTDIIDVSLPTGSTQLATFTPSTYGTYIFSTTYHGGNAGSGANDTLLYVYNDANFSNLIAYNDDYGGTSFSQVKLNLMPGKTYYIKLQAYGGAAINSRLSSIQTTTAFSTLFPDTATIVSQPIGVPEFFRFTPAETGTYQFKTSPYGGNGPVNDTLLELYDSETLTTPIQINDNADGTVFSRLHHTLTGGTEYYLVMKEAQAGQVYADLIVEKINPLPTVDSISGPGTAFYSINGYYELFAYGVEDQVSGIASVKFHTWTALNGQDDLVIHNGIDLGSGTWKATIPYNEHQDEVGTYMTEVYINTNGNVQTLVGTIKTEIKAQGPFQYVYLLNGLLDHIILSNGQHLKYEYDSNGNLLRVRLQHP